MSASLPNAEIVHQAFRANSEFAKLLRRISLVFEILAGTLAGVGLGEEQKNLMPFLALLSAGISLVVRLYIGGIESFAQTCRRQSIRAHGMGRDLNGKISSNAKSNTPRVGQWLVSRLHTNSLLEYYDSSLPPGEGRLRSMYAESAFWSWQLNRCYAWVLWSLAAIIGVTGVWLLYGLAQSEEHLANRALYLDVISSVVLAILFLRAVEAAFQVTGTARSTSKLADAFVCQPLVGGELLNELMTQYDIERCLAPQIPTLLYSMKHDKLTELWKLRKEDLAH